MATPRKLDFPDVTDPNFDPDVPFEADNGLTYKWNGNAWEVVCGAGTETDGFLLKHGHDVDDAPDTVEYKWNQDVRVRLDNTNFDFNSENTNDYFSVSEETGGIYLDALVDVVALKGKKRTDIRSDGDVTLEGISGAERVDRVIGDTDIDQQIVNKRFLDEKVAFLQSEIIELEEEIDAIAPSVERGLWTFNSLGAVTNQGQLALYDADFSSGGAPTSVFKDAGAIWLNELDNTGTPHGFDGVEAGELIELFVQGKEEYGLYEVTGIHDQTETFNSYWVIDVTFVRTLEDTSAADNGDIIRVKIFNAPSGGAADEFVLKEGDDMTGRLSMDQVADLEDFTVPSLRTDPSIRFLTTKSDDSTSTYSLLYQPGYRTGLVCTSGFYASTLITSTYVYGYKDKTESDGRITRDTKKAGLAFIRPDDDDTSQDYAYLAYNSTNKRLIWNANRVEIPKPIGDNTTAEGFIIKGAISTDGYSGIGTNVQHNETLLNVKHNAGQSDAINYYGRISGDNNIVTKEYVDNNSGGVDVRTDNPSNPDIGHLWYNTSTNQFLLRIS